MAGHVANRVQKRPHPDQWGDSEYMTLKEAVAVFWPDGPLTVASLRTEIANGRLAPASVAGKFFVTPAQLRALFEPKPCPHAPKAHASTGAKAGPKSARRTSGSSGTDRQRSALAAAQMAINKLSKRSPLTSQTSGSPKRDQPIGQVIRPAFSSPK